MPWIKKKTLNEATTEDIELSVCGNEDYLNEDVIDVFIR